MAGIDRQHESGLLEGAKSLELRDYAFLLPHDVHKLLLGGTKKYIVVVGK